MKLNWTNQRWKFRIKAVLGMLLGSFVVVAVLLYLNTIQSSKNNEKELSASYFQVVKKIKTPKKETPKPKQQKRQQPTTVSPLTPLLADLGIGMSAISLNIGAFDARADVISAGDDVLGDTSNVIMTGDSIDQQPRVLTRAPFQYPARAKAKGIEGYVLLSILINEKGQVEEVRVLGSDPKGTFEEVAVRNIKRWQFSPAKYNQQAVRAWINQQITFRLG